MVKKKKEKFDNLKWILLCFSIAFIIMLIGYTYTYVNFTQNPDTMGYKEGGNWYIHLTLFIITLEFIYMFLIRWDKDDLEDWVTYKFFALIIAFFGALFGTLIYALFKWGLSLIIPLITFETFIIIIQVIGILIIVGIVILVFIGFNKKIFNWMTKY